MPAYVIAESEHLDGAEIRRYRELAAAAVARHGGRYLVRGATPDAREGHWAPDHRIVVIEFPPSTARTGGTTRRSTGPRSPPAATPPGAACSSSTVYPMSQPPRDGSTHPGHPLYRNTAPPDSVGAVATIRRRGGP